MRAGDTPKAQLVRVQEPEISPLALAEKVLGPIFEPLTTVGIVLVVVVFLLLQREDLRNRMIRLFGSGDLHRTTVAMDDAAARLGTYFLAQLGMNAAFGVIVGVGLAYGLQTRQATLADRACEQIRLRLETALRRSDCGLWDWDIARGRIYWSDSMYALLGYRREQAYLAFGTVNALVHPDDGDLYSLARAVAASQSAASSV